GDRSVAGDVFFTGPGHGTAAGRHRTPDDRECGLFLCTVPPKTKSGLRTEVNYANRIASRMISSLRRPWSTDVSSFNRTQAPVQRPAPCRPRINLACI